MPTFGLQGHMIDIPQTNIAPLVTGGEQQPISPWMEAHVHNAVLTHLHMSHMPLSQPALIVRTRPERQAALRAQAQ